MFTFFPIAAIAPIGIWWMKIGHGFNVDSPGLTTA